MAIVKLDQVSLHYLQLGSDAKELENIILVHGLATNLSFWYFSIAPILAENARVTLFDLRGHGRSSMPKTGYRAIDFVEDLVQLLDYLKIEKAHILGHSLGGLITANFANKYPDRLASLILVDARLKVFQPTMKLADWPQWQQYLPLLEKLNIQVDFTSEELGYQLLAEMARLHIQAPALSAKLKAILPSPLFAGFTFQSRQGKHSAKRLQELLENTSALQDLSQPDELTLESLAQITCPILAVYGAQSQTLSTLHGLTKIWPQLQSEIIPGTGHFFPITQPQALLKPLSKFLVQISSK